MSHRFVKNNDQLEINLLVIKKGDRVLVTSLVLKGILLRVVQ